MQDRDFVVVHLEEWGEWNRSGVYAGKYRCTLSAPFSGSPPQEQAGYVPVRVQAMEAGILALNQSDRRLVRLVKKRFIRQLPYELIASDYGISKTTVYRQLCRAYDFLAPYLQYETKVLCS